MNIFNNISNEFDSDYESDLDISWIKEQEKLQQINENYFKEQTLTDEILIALNFVEIRNYQHHFQNKIESPHTV
jgi:hypothetical protein